MWLRRFLLRFSGSKKQKTEVKVQKKNWGVCPVCNSLLTGEGDARTYFEYWCTNPECDYADKQFT